MMYFAHSPKEKEGIPAQTYSDHVNGVVNKAHKHACRISRHAKLDGEQVVRAAEIAAAYHDMGKLDKENQAVLSGEKQGKKLPISHSDAGTAYLLDEKHLSTFPAVIVHSHHCGLPDFVEERKQGKVIFRDAAVMKKVDADLPVYASIHGRLIQKAFVFGQEDIQGDRSVFLRLLLSCVVDADHTNTAIHYKKYPADQEEILLRADERLEALNKYVAGFKGKREKRNLLRREMYEACKHAEVDANISSCDSPVGSGKTTAVMAHLLVQAQKRNLRRIFVVLPFTNIIKQSVDTYRNSLVLSGEKPEEVVAELHHRADFQSADERHLTALWRAPIIVTTAVAFFETMASATPASLRRLHELPGSAVFVDESHAALPARLLPLAWRWINIYAREWNCYWVLASGSPNRFWTIQEIAKNINGVKDVREIVHNKLREQLSCYEVNRIAYKHDLQPRSAEELANWISGFEGPRLVIMNTVQSAAVLAEQFSSCFGRKQVEHLSTALTPNDRDATLERVKKRLKRKKDTNWTLVATSCVEAGVDLSFRNGFRELGALVSLLQAAGRVNRDGRYNDSSIWTFCIAKGAKLIPNPGMDESAKILRGYLEKGEKIGADLSTQSIADEIKMYATTEKYQTIVKYEQSQRFPLVEKEFQVINGDTRIVVVDKDVAEGIRQRNVSWQELQKVSVRIAVYNLKKFGVSEIAEDIYQWKLDYNDFLGYMAGVLPLPELGEGMFT